MLLPPLRSRNGLALALLVLGKIFGLLGVLIGPISRTLGAFFLLIAGILVISAIVVCVDAMRRGPEGSAED
jgi:hypothetical protein